MQSLETLLVENPQRSYRSGALYSGLPSNQMHIYDFGGGYQVHLHNDAGYGHVEHRGQDIPGSSMNAYESAMFAHRMTEIGLDPIVRPYNHHR